VSHFHILEKLGGGSMNVVYKPGGTGLTHPVALNFLPKVLPRDCHAQ